MRAVKNHYGRAVSTVCVLALAPVVDPAIGQAQSTDAGAPAPSAAPQPDNPVISEVVVTGTRFEGRIPIESPTPIDSISAAELTQGGRTEIVSMLKVAVPSFNTPRPAGSSFADFATPATLRGLSPGQVLVLVNGKRRHTIGELNQTNGIGRGDITYDFNAIPAAAIGRVEVLRDGAAAQYGSDAIAGVINVVLDDSPGASFKGTVGTAAEDDGEVVDMSASYGLPIGSDGIIRVTTQYQDHEATDRSRPDTRQQYLGSNGGAGISGNFGSGVGLTPATGTLDPREATMDRDVFRIGESAFTMKSAMINSELPLSDAIELYAFGGYSRLDGVSPGFFRRSGQDENVRSIYPDGYRPQTQVRFKDYTAAAGMRGGDPASLSWDFSSVYSGSEIDLHHFNSVNPSFGAASPTDFDKGGTRNRQWTTSLDLARAFDLGYGDPLKVAIGLEYRREYYDLLAGEPASYLNGGIPILDGPNAGRPAPVGSQPTPGTAASDAITADRHSKAAYIEVEKELFDRLTMVGALRHENYSDFGSTTDYKLASRLELTDWLAVRANYGTGFRAPALAHSFFNTTSTGFISGQQFQLRVFRVAEPAARLLGATDLAPETAQNLSLGTVLNFDSFTASIDYYRIEIDGRIVVSSNFQDPRVTALLAQNGFPGISAATYLTNAVDSVTRGVDVTVNYRLDLARYGTLTTTLAGNVNESKLTRIAGTPAPLAALGLTTPLFDLTQQVRFTDSYPKDKVSLSFSWNRDPLAVRLTGTHYGEVSAVALTNRTPAQIAALTPGYDVRLVPVAPTSPNVDVIQTFGDKILIDLEVTCDISDNVALSVGANNIFNIYPTENIRSTLAGVAAGSNGADNAGTVPYNQISPFGFSGRFVFASMSVKF